MLRKKKKNKGAFHALSIGETQGKEVCYRKRYREKMRKKEETQGTTRKNNQPTPQKDLHTLSLYRGRKHGGTKREVRTTHHACHASLLRVYRTSSSAF